MKLDAEIEHLAIELGKALGQRGWLAATAESCTGGGVATAITDIAGSSGWFDRGFVTYTNEAKQQMLGVSGESLEQHGAVSETVVLEMARGALAHLCRHQCCHQRHRRPRRCDTGQTGRHRLVCLGGPLLPSSLPVGPFRRGSPAGAPAGGETGLVGSVGPAQINWA